MTVTQLIKALEKVREQAPRARVLIDWKSFEHGEWSHVQMTKAEIEYIPFDDGGPENKDGSEKMRKVVTLSGPYAKE